MKEPFIKIYKKMLKWEWYDDINTCRLFIHCLLRANWEAGSWHGIEYNKGEFITSLPTLAKETGLSVQQVRTAILHLKSTGELTDKAYSKFRIITVVKWNEYQGDNRQSNRQITDNQQASNRQVTADKEIKEIKEIKNIYTFAFEEFWKIYPRKQEKSKAYKQYQARLKDGYTEEQLLMCCKNYAAVCERNRTEQRYIKHGATFLSVNEPFLDYMEMPKGEVVKPKQENVNKKIHNYEERKYDFDAMMKEATGE